MSDRTTRWSLCLGLLLMGMSLAGGTTVAAGMSQPGDVAGSIRIEQASPVAHDVGSRQSPVALTSVGMSDLMSQTFEFAGAFPSGWQVYDAISPTVGNYLWSTTTITRAEGAHSAAAALGGVSGATLTPTAGYAAPVDSWMVYGPANLGPVWQAQLAFAYYFTPTASGVFTVGVSTDYDPNSRTGTFSEVTLDPTPGWVTYTRDLSTYAGQKVYVAFHYRTPDGGNAADGPFVDDVHLRVNYRALLPMISKWTLSLAKSASSNVAWAGQPLVYSITVYNKDAVAASGVLLTDTVPTGTVFVSADGGGTFDAASRVVSWPGLTVPAGGSVVQHLTITVPSGDLIGFRVVNQDYAISVPPNPTIMFGLPVTTPVALDYADDFTNPASGWPVGEYDPNNEFCFPPPGSWRAGYMPGGTYGVATACDRAAQLYPAPVRLADTRNFTLEIDLRSAQGDLWASSWGLFFNGIEDLHEVYNVQVYQGQDPPEWDVRYWENFNWSDQITPPAAILGGGTCYDCSGQDGVWNHLLVRRAGDMLEVWMGYGQGRSHLARQGAVQYSKATGSQYNRVGVHHSNFEWRFDAYPGNYAYVFDNFFLSPATR